MKKLALLVMFWVPCMECLSQPPARQAREDFKKLNWLEGTWYRTNNKAGQSGTERWFKSSPYEIRGFGVTLKGQDTLFVENLRIVINEDRIYYVADVPENQQPVFFKLTEITKTGFVFENPDHDFPKKIVYQAANNILKATVSGGNNSLDYIFEKQ